MRERRRLGEVVDLDQRRRRASATNVVDLAAQRAQREHPVAARPTRLTTLTPRPAAVPPHPAA